VLAGLYALYTVGVAVFQPRVGARAAARGRKLGQPDGSSGTPSVAVLVASPRPSRSFRQVLLRAEIPEAMLDERLVLAAAPAPGSRSPRRSSIARSRLGLLSRLAEQVIFVLIPPLASSSSCSARSSSAGRRPPKAAPWAPRALVDGVGAGRLSFKLMRQAMDTTAKLSTFVVFILIGARVFSLTSTASTATSGSSTCC
jgi:TRAP-type mannitol/chloroaromatic compound transport system permease large subunit